MSARSLAAALAAVVAAAALAPGMACAQKAKQAATAPKTSYYDPWQPDNIQRVQAKLQKVEGMTVVFTTTKGESLKVAALNSSLLLLRNMLVADAKQFQAGDKLIVYYNLPPPEKKGEMKILWAVTDPRSELLLLEMRGKPVEGTYKSFDAATRKLTIQSGGRSVTYPLIAPMMIIREGREATFGAPPAAAKEKEKQKEKRYYASGDKLTLVRTLDGKKVRMVLDRATLEQFAPGIKRFPLPPASQIPK